MDAYIEAKENPAQLWRLFQDFQKVHLPELRRKASEDDEQVVEVLSAILSGLRNMRAQEIQNASQGNGHKSAPRTEDNINKAIAVMYITAVGFLKAEHSKPFLDRLHSILELDGKEVPQKVQVSIVEKFLDDVKKGKKLSKNAIEIFVSLIRKIETFETVDFRKMEIPGKECKDIIMKDIVQSESACVDSLTYLVTLAMFGSLPERYYESVKEQVDEIFAKVYLASPDRHSELPFVAQHLLDISQKSGRTGDMLESLLVWFRKLDEKYWTNNDITIANVSRFWQHEATTVIYTATASGKDQDIPVHLQKLLRLQISLPGRLLNPFTLAVSLAISGTNNIDDAIIGLLSQAILNVYKERMTNQRESIYFRKTSENSSQNIDLLTNILPLIKLSQYGKFIYPQLTKLAFKLIDFLPPKTRSKVLCKPQEILTAKENACILGCRLLLETFRAHQDVREEIMGKLFSRISNSPRILFIEILENLVSRCPQDFLKLKDSVMDIISFIPNTEVDQAAHLLRAMMPLLRHSVELKNCMMTTFRQNIMHRSISARLISVTGFLTAMKYFKIQGAMPWSQSQGTQLSLANASQTLVGSQTFNANSYEALCMELGRIIQKCLEQPLEIREAVYCGLYKVVRRNTGLLPLVSRILLKQLKKYLNNPNFSSVLAIEDCVDSKNTEQPTLREPLASLLMSMQLLVRLGDSLESSEYLDQSMANAKDEAVASLREALAKVLDGMEHFELEALGISRSEDLSGDNNLKYIQTTLMLRIMEVLFEYQVMSFKETEGNSEKALVYYMKAKSFAETMAKAEHNAKAKKKPVGLKKQAKKGKKTLLSEDNTPEQSEEDNDATQECEANAAEISAHITASQAPARFQQKLSARAKVMSVHSLEFLVSILDKVLKKENDSRSLGGLARNTTLHNNLVVSLAAKLETFITFGEMDGFCTQNWDSIYIFLSGVARTLYAYLHECIGGSDEDYYENCSHSLLVETVKTLAKIFTLFQNYNPGVIPKLTVFIQSTTSDEETIQDETTLIGSVETCLKKITTLFCKSTELSDLFDSIPSYLAIIDVLTTNSKVSLEALKEVFEILKRLIQENDTKDAAVARTVLSTAFHLCSRINSRRQKRSTAYVNLVTTLCCETHKVYGDIDESFTSEYDKQFQMVNSKTVTDILGKCALPKVKAYMDEIDSAFQVLETNIAVLKDEFSVEQREDSEVEICTALMHMVNCLSELTLTNIPSSYQNTFIITETKKFFNFMVKLVKYYLKRGGGKKRATGNSLPEKFIELVEHCGRHLTGEELVSFLSNTDNEPNKQKKRNANGEVKQNAEKEKKTIKKGIKTSTLIVAIEQYDRQLQKLGKLYGTPNLVKNNRAPGKGREFRLRLSGLDKN